MLLLSFQGVDADACLENLCDWQRIPRDLSIVPRLSLVPIHRTPRRCFMRHQLTEHQLMPLYKVVEIHCTDLHSTIGDASFWRSRWIVSHCRILSCPLVCILLLFSADLLDVSKPHIPHGNSGWITLLLKRQLDTHTTSLCLLISPMCLLPQTHKHTSPSLTF